MAYDSVIVSFTTKTDKVDLVQAAHVNSVQAELVTIETILGTNVKGNRADLKTRLNNALDADGSLLSGTSFPSPALSSQPFWRTDLDTFYIYGTSGWIQQGGSIGNLLFCYVGNVNEQGASVGEYTGTSFVPDGATGNYRFLQRVSTSSYQAIQQFKWTKISGVSTVTVHVKIWNRLNSVSQQANLQVDIGGQAGNVSGTANQITPEWKSFTINVSSLTNGTTYDVVASIKDVANQNEECYCSHIIGFGS